MLNKFYEGVEFSRCLLSYCRQRHSSAVVPIELTINDPWAIRALSMFAKHSGVSLSHCIDVVNCDTRPLHDLLQAMKMTEHYDVVSCESCSSRDKRYWYRFRGGYSGLLKPRADAEL